MTPNPNPSPELLERARKYVRLATMTGNKTANPLNHVSIMEDMLTALSQTLPAPGEVERMAIDQNDAMRQELAHVGNLVSDLERAMHADPARADGTWPDLGGRIRHLTNVALATVAAANDEGVADDQAIERRVRIAAWNAAKKSGATDALGYAVVEAVVAEFAAIRLLPQGGGK